MRTAICRTGACMGVIRTAPRNAARRCRYLSSSSTSHQSSASQSDLRTMILTAALKHVPQYGFSIRALQAAAESLPALQAFTSRMAVEQLFPSPPPREPLRLKKGSTQAGSVVNTSAMDIESQQSERIGPMRALFEAWTDDKRRELQEALAPPASGSMNAQPGLTSRAQSAKDALKTRLEYNLPVLPYLPEAIASLGLPDPAKASLPSLQPYLTHVRQIAHDVKELTREEASLVRLATVYSLSEIYQISSPSKPDMEEVRRYVDDLYASTQKYDGVIRDTVQFGEYVLGSFKSIWHSRGF